MPEPPPLLERVVGWFIPPACQEEVLGDLHEQYRSPLQYICTAVCVIPCVIASRIRRNADVRWLLINSLLMYAAFVAAGWWLDRPSLNSSRGLLILGLPAWMQLAGDAFSAAWAGADGWFSKWLSRGSSFVFVSIFWMNLGVFLFGSAGYLLLASGLRFALPSDLIVSYAVEPPVAEPTTERKAVGIAVLTFVAVAIVAEWGWLRGGLVIGMFLAAAGLDLLRTIYRA